MTTQNDNPFAVDSQQRTFVGPILKTLTLVSLCCIAAYAIHVVSRSWLIERLSYGLAEHPPHVQSERLAMLAEFGDAGLPALVKATISENETLSANAYRTLVELQGRWVTGAIGDAPTMNLALVTAIENHIAKCPPERRPLLSSLLNQTILDTVESGHTKDEQSFQKGQKLIAMLGPASPSPSKARNESLGNRPVFLADDATGSLILDGDGGNDDSELRSGSLFQPLPVNLLSVAESTDSQTQTSDVTLPNWKSADGNSIRFQVASSSTEPQTAPTDNAAPVDNEPIEGITDNPLATYDTRSVIDFLASPQPSLVQAAETELRKRKLTDAELLLARRLTSPEPEVRMAMIKELPARTDVDPRTWLLWLSSDLERRVRVEAIDVLGSMNDPAITNTLRERLRTERDTYVLSRLRKILNLR